MFGFEITSDLLIVAIFAQTIAIALIVLIIYFKIKKIQQKNIDLNEKIEQKLDKVGSKLSYLYNQVLVISAKQDKFNYHISSLDPSTHYRTKATTNEESDSLSLLKNTPLYGQNSRDSRIVDPRLTATKAKESETESVPVLEASSISQPKSESAFTITSSSLPSDHHSFSELSTSNNLSDAAAAAAAKDTTIGGVQNNKAPTSTKSFADNDSPIEKNTNPEIEKMEKEILTALKRLGRSDGDSDSNGDVDDYGEDSGEDGGGGGRGEGGDVLYSTAKKAGQKG
jgi:cell division protein FtsN